MLYCDWCPNIYCYQKGFKPFAHSHTNKVVSSSENSENTIFTYKMTQTQSIVLIKKGGSFSTKKCKTFSIDTIYKKCDFKSAKGFGHRYTFKVKKHYIHVFAKDNGRAGHENKFDLPPPVDSALYFGTIALIKSTSKSLTMDNIEDYNAGEWDKDYSVLMGGFEDIGKSEDDYESDELEGVPDDMKTKEGYLKDGFVVSGDDDTSYQSTDGGVNQKLGAYQESSSEGSVTDEEELLAGEESDEEDEFYDSELEEEEYLDEA